MKIYGGVTSDGFVSLYTNRERRDQFKSYYSRLFEFEVPTVEQTVCPTCKRAMENDKVAQR